MLRLNARVVDSVSVSMTARVALMLVVTMSTVAHAQHAAKKACEVELRLHSIRTAREVRLFASLKNKTGSTKTLTLKNQCPSPSVTFSGVPDGVDVFELCTRGACVSKEPIVITLKPGEQQRLATGSLPSEKTACSAPFTGGPHTVTFSVPIEGDAPVLCGPTPLTLSGFDEPAPTERHCPPVACGGCPGGYVKSPDGCTTCQCIPLGPALSPVKVPAPSH